MSGTAAGAVGTAALNAPLVPIWLSGAGLRAASRLRYPMSSKRRRGLTCPERAKAGSEGSTAQNRRSGLGALSGYVGGLGVGTGCGLIRPSPGGALNRAPVSFSPSRRWLVADNPATALGATDLRRWSLNSCVSDTVPHLAYGLTTAVARDALISV